MWGRALEIYERNGFHNTSATEAYSGEESEEAVKENGRVRQIAVQGKRPSRSSLGSQMSGASFDGDMAITSASSMPGKRRIRNTSGSPPPVHSDEDSLHLKRSPIASSHSLRAPAERRSKSRGESKDSAGYIQPDRRAKATSPSPPSGYHRQHVEARVPKRTPRLSPRGSLSGLSRPPASKELDDRAFQSWEREAQARAGRRSQAQAQELGDSSTLPPSNVSHLGDDYGPAVDLRGSYHPSASSQELGLSPLAGPTVHDSSVLMSPSCYPDENYQNYADEYQHPAHSSASMSGTTTPTESGDLPLLRIRNDGKSAQQVQDSRIMKLIGKRSVLSGASLYAESATVTRRSARESRTHRGALSRSLLSSPSSPPPGGAGPGSTYEAGEFQQPLASPKSGGKSDAKPLGEANRRLPTSGLTMSSQKLESSSITLDYADAKAKAENALMAALLSTSPSQEALLRELSPQAEQLAQAEFCPPSPPVQRSTEKKYEPDRAGPYPVEAAAELPADNGFLKQDLAKNLLDSFSTSGVAPSCYPVEADDPETSAPETAHAAPTFGLASLDCTEGQSSASDMRIPAMRAPADEMLAVDEAPLQHPALSSDAVPKPTPSGASQVDMSSSIEGSSGNAIIWPGLSGHSGKDEASSQRNPQPQVSYAAAAVSSNTWPSTSWPSAEVPGVVPASPAADPTQGAVVWPSALLQNEAGSLVVPHTWRFVPPPPQALPASPDRSTTGPVSPGADGQLAIAETEPGTMLIRPMRDEADPATNQSSQASIEAPPARPLDFDAKRQLLAELVECLTVRAHKAEQALGAEQRTNRALNVTLEVLQRQNLALQQQVQQLTYIAQLSPYMAAVQSGEAQLQVMPDGSTALVTTQAVSAVQQGAVVDGGGALPVDAVGRIGQSV